MTESAWWREGVIYQIYPRSFMDASGDGVGDLEGILRRLDYLAELGVDALWISPIFPSPMKDFGYDVADYTDIDPLFGDLATFDRLLAAAHQRGLKVILDYVPNHSSDQHPWFIESRSSRDNPRADWYFWRDAAPDGGPPNNWLSFFGGPAWSWDETRQQYYLHMFLPEQPDLNWFNPQVEAAMLDVLRFWMRRGVDGFRMDVIFVILKHPDLPDNPPATSPSAGRSMGEFDSIQHVYDFNWPERRQYLVSTIRRTLDEFPERVGIGETYILNVADLVPFYGDALDGLHLPFNFTLMHAPWRANAFRQTIAAYYDALPPGAQPNFVLGSHDEHRLATRYGYANHRSAGLLLLTLRGTPTLYYGDEIGMVDVDIPPEKEQDPHGLRVPGLGLGRDPERTPMQWDASPHAGFTPARAEPWLPLAPDYERVNVAVQDQDPDSTLNFYRRLLRLRRQSADLRGEAFAWLEGLPPDVLGYARGRLRVLINFGDQAHTLNLGQGRGRGLLSTHQAGEATLDMAALPLRPHEGWLIELP